MSKRQSELPPRVLILSTSVALFAERGYDAVSLRSIANEVELHNSTLFHYFRDKATLARACVDAVAEQWRQDVAALGARSGADPMRFLDVIRSLASRAAENPSEAKLLRRALWEQSAPWRSGEDAGAPLPALLAALRGWLEHAARSSRSALEDPDLALDLLCACLLARPRGGGPAATRGHADAVTRFVASALQSSASEKA